MGFLDKIGKWYADLSTTAEPKSVQEYMPHQQATQMQREIVIIVLDHRAGRYEAEQIAKKNGGQLLTVKDFIQLLNDPIKYAKMKNDWYWTANTGIVLSGYLKIDYENGTLGKVSEEEYGKLAVKKRAYAMWGSGPVALAVGYGGDIKYHGIQFYVDASESERSYCVRGAIRVVLKKKFKKY